MTYAKGKKHITFGGVFSCVIGKLYSIHEMETNGVVKLAFCSTDDADDEEMRR